MAFLEFPHHCPLAPRPQGSPSLGTLRQAVALSYHPLPVLPSIPSHRSHLIKDKQEEGKRLKSKGVWGWAGECLPGLVRAATPCQDKVRFYPPLTTHPVWPRSVLPTRRASRRLKITEASLCRSRSSLMSLRQQQQKGY